MEYEKKVLKYRAVCGEPWLGWQWDRWSWSGHYWAPAMHGELSGESCEQALANSAWKSQSLAAAFPGQPAGRAKRLCRLQQHSMVGGKRPICLRGPAGSQDGPAVTVTSCRAFDSMGLLHRSPLNGSEPHGGNNRWSAVVGHGSSLLNTATSAASHMPSCDPV